MTGLAAAAPVLVVIEDAHWAEESLLRMIERMLARSAGPLLVVVSARPEFAEGRPGWSSRPAVSQIALEPLTETQSRKLIGELLPQAGPELLDQVVATAEGNPLFAEELARHVSGGNGQPIAIPSTIRALLAARVDALPDRDKQVLQNAAVVGRVFWGTSLESIDPRPDLIEALEALEDRGLVVTRASSSLPGETELCFRHGLIREVAYRSIPRARRCRSHAAAGRWLERLQGDRREEFVDLIAHHLESASAPADAALAWPGGSPEYEQLRASAVRALTEAGHGARKRMDLDQALRFAHRAEVLVATDRERLEVLEVQARTHHAALRGDDALAAYAAAIKIARALNDRDAVSRLRAHAILLCVRYRVRSTVRTGKRRRSSSSTKDLRTRVWPPDAGTRSAACWPRLGAPPLARARRSRGRQTRRQAGDRGRRDDRLPGAARGGARGTDVARLRGGLLRGRQDGRAADARQRRFH